MSHENIALLIGYFLGSQKLPGLLGIKTSSREIYQPSLSCTIDAVPFLEI